ncbi:SAM-dependent methyltransferase [Dissulfurirhabdus thermomarina]|uniref:SAM-dependent methyltransferase n=1 Tax=Dissulfurirhabdus thermomarina TaxID=1765737 RepID=A0A6N9TME6_DISTH|nr:SAM-dependent methyltransferase [Dissulfurirhabdus thermomarina]NDY42415.1 SAM-dependent methyltransferase [Dissulfurirhabdus thermomarina]NMX23815.1 SAM-dependent methyltransferase [Dissulfurirhabdus thermomarina]
MTFEMHPIGRVCNPTGEVPRHWTVSRVEGAIEIDPAYEAGLSDIRPGDRVVVLFAFHESPPFSPELLRQRPPHRDRERGVFSICSPVRPNPIGLSVVEVLSVEGPVLRVRGLDMRDGTPVLDLKPATGLHPEVPGGRAA